MAIDDYQPLTKSRRSLRASIIYAMSIFSTAVVQIAQHTPVIPHNVQIRASSGPGSFLLSPQPIGLKTISPHQHFIC